VVCTETCQVSSGEFDFPKSLLGLLDMNTNQKGNIGTASVVKDLIQKGFEVFIPFSEHSVVDLIALKDNKSYRLQVKYSKISEKNISRIRPENTFKYKDGDFDFYALYIPEKDYILYAPIEFGGCAIRFSLPLKDDWFWWFEDFQEIRELQKHKRKRSTEFPNWTPESLKRNKIPEHWPTLEVVQELVWKMPMVEIAKIYGVSDSMVAKWCKKYKINRPSKGYWQKQKSLINAGLV
jgi:hypothetical protein